MKNAALALAVLVVFGSATAYGAEEPENRSPESDPVALIDGFHSTLLGVMKDAKTLGIQERYERLEPAVDGTFSLPLMIRIASGSYWSKAAEPERGELGEAFTRMSVATYADRFDGYSGESFELTGTRPGPQGTTLVDTKLVRVSDDPVDITYVVRDVQGEWRVVDVLLEGGISELARYRSEYSKILRDKGVPGLIEELDAKTAVMLETSVAGQQ